MIPAMNIPDCTGTIAYLVRHAERDPIEMMADALVPRLTKKGESDAYSLGQQLSRCAPLTLYHSPVPRCQQTAECIARGITSSNQSAAIAGALIDLGGPYITGDWNGIVTNIEKLGHASFIRKWFDNELPPELIMPLKEAARTQLGILANQLMTGTTSTVNITHDWNIMIVREYYFNLRHEDIGDPAFLDGVYAYLQDGALRLIYHEHTRTVELPQPVS